MNCSSGDLAVVVRTGPMAAKCLGAIIRVSSMTVIDGIEVWRYEPLLHYPNGEPISFAEDCCLRPIKDQDGEDEMLLIAGKPKERVA